MNYSVALPSRETIDQPKLATGNILGALRRGAWLIILLAVVGGGGAYAFSSSLPRRYTASGTVVLAAQHFAIPELQGAVRGSSDADPMLLVRTELQALSAPQLLEQVIGELHLDTMKEFNPALAAPGPLDQVSGAIHRWIAGPPPPAPPGAIGQAVLAQVSRDLVVFNDNRSLVATISFTSGSPTLCANFINTLIRRYRDMRSRERGEADQEANGTLVTRIAALEGEITALEKQAGELRDKSQYIGLRAGSVGQQKLEELATEATKASLDRAEIQATWERAAALAKRGESDQMSGVLTSDTMSRLRDQEATAARKYAELIAHYGPNYPGVRQARGDLQAIQGLLAQEVARIVDSLDAQFLVARQHEADAQQQLAAARGVAVANTSVQTRLDDLAQDIAARRQLVQSLQVGMQQTISMPAGDALEVRVLSAAEPPNRASSPKPTLAGVFGVAAGGAIGVLFSLVSTRSSLGGAAPAAIARGLPVFAVLPAFAGRGRRRLLAAISSRPTGEIADVLRTLRLRIRASAKAGAPRIVTLIPTHSTQTGALIALAFARLAAADGERVLLIEGSLQTPVLAPLLGLRLPHGLAVVLEGKPHWRDALAHDTQSSLDLLLADRGAANAQALLTSMRFQNVLTEARDDYHLIVLSAPSTEVAAGALTLANCADATVLVFDDNRHTSSDAVGRFVEDLVMTSTGPVAAMLTRAA